jgi:hypothetical protein
VDCQTTKMPMKINKSNSIRKVLFIVEGGKTEFNLLRRIFCDILEYEYIQKARQSNNFKVYKSRSNNIVANFVDDTHLIQFAIGEEVKSFVAQNNTTMQHNKINESTVKRAAIEMMKYFETEQITFDINNIGHTNSEVFEKQETKYSYNNTYKLASLLSVALIDLGILEIEGS